MNRYLMSFFLATVLALFAGGERLMTHSQARFGGSKVVRMEISFEKGRSFQIAVPNGVRVSFNGYSLKPSLAPDESFVDLAVRAPGDAQGHVVRLGKLVAPTTVNALPRIAFRFLTVYDMPRS
jgi:hypothetical protein